MRINVIMPLYLGDYPGAASNRKEKFIRAVQSFMSQDHPDRKLIIVVDGTREDGCGDQIDFLLNCDWWIGKNVGQAHEDWREFPKGWQSRTFPIPKTAAFSGAVRNKGIELSKQEDAKPDAITCYLDGDDMLMPGHLQNIAENFGDHDWVYFNDNFALNADFSKTTGRVALPVSGSIGTSNIAHRTDLNITWPDGYGHDWELINSMHHKYPNYKKIPGGGYLVCHVPGGIDF